MKKRNIFSAIICFCVVNSTLADVVVGPLPQGTMCPSGSLSDTKGRSVYCSFYDTNVVAAGIGSCPSNIPAAIKTESTVGRHTWCIVSKPVQPARVVKSSNDPEPPPTGKEDRISESGINAVLKTAKLCEDSEQTVFACNTGKKSVSVCSSKNGLQYRYGIDRNKLDIQLDAKNAATGQYALAGGGVWYFRIPNGKINYVVYTAESSAIDKAGLVVEQGDKRLANLTCKNAVTIHTELAGSATDQQGFEIP